MPKPEPLTDEQIAIINTRYESLTINELTKECGLINSYRVSSYMRSHGLKRPYSHLNEKQQKVVVDNYQYMGESVLMHKLGLKDPYLIRKFMAAKGLAYACCEVSNITDKDAEEGFFELKTYKNWLS